jgi:hypothetical protein
MICIRIISRSQRYDLFSFDWSTKDPLTDLFVLVKNCDCDRRAGPAPCTAEALSPPAGSFQPLAASRARQAITATSAYSAREWLARLKYKRNDPSARHRCGLSAVAQNLPAASGSIVWRCIAVGLIEGGASSQRDASPPAPSPAVPSPLRCAVSATKA